MQWNRIEVTVFGPDQQPLVRVSAGAETAPGAEAPAPLAVMDAGGASAPNAMLDRAMGLLEANLARPYYDEAADAELRQAYYAEVLPLFADGGSDADRYRALSRLVKGTHTRVLSYGDARHQHLYTWVDLQENGMLRSLYTGDEYPPKQVIESDLALEAERVEQFRAWMSGAAGLAADVSLSDLQAQLDAADEQGPFNCEHVVPQAWFKPRSTPMKSDLHHLFTCDPRCNSTRGNIPFGITGLAGERCGKQSGNEFEPAQGKGPAARATLYFMLRYPGEINDRASEYTASDIATLLQWHRDEPVSRFELHRNAGVQTAQGNRNPLIDFPDWADRIDFRLGLG